jgi:hypothetical protein
MTTIVMSAIIPPGIVFLLSEFGGENPPLWYIVNRLIIPYWHAELNCKDGLLEPYIPKFGQKKTPPTNYSCSGAPHTIFTPFKTLNGLP